MPVAPRAIPLGGLGLAVCALTLWVSGLPLGWLDALALSLFALGFLLSLAGYLRGDELATRRLGIVGLGANALGLAAITAVLRG